MHGSSWRCLQNINTFIFNSPNKHCRLAFTILSLQLILNFCSNALWTLTKLFPLTVLNVGFHSFLPTLFLVTNAMTHNDPAQNTSHVYHETCNNADCQFHCSQEVAWVHQRNFYVLPPVFYYVIEVLPNSGILRVFRGHVNHERMSFIFLYTLGLKHKKHEIILQKQISKDHYSVFIHLFTISILYCTLLLTATVIICFLYPSHC